jgi:hypothetical protein
MSMEIIMNIKKVPAKKPDKKRNIGNPPSASAQLSLSDLSLHPGL